MQVFILFERFTFLSQSQLLDANNFPPEYDSRKVAPDVEIDLYSLNVTAINEAYQKFIESNCNYDVWASSTRASEDGSNCVKLVVSLLVAGGIEKLFIKVPQPRAIGKGIAIGSVTGLAFGVGIAFFMVAHTTPAAPVLGLAALAYKASMATGLATAGIKTVAVAGGIGAVGGGSIGGAVGALTGGAGGTAYDIRNAIVTPADMAKLALAAQKVECTQYEFFEPPEENIISELQIKIS